jgi:starch synthase (maltosyl-transferring)
MRTAPRIYNLFPLLAGSITEWEMHLPRIADMGFDWVFLNPFHAPGFSGSLYAVKDYYRLNPLFRGRSRKDADKLLAGFVAAARGHGLKVMMDLVINHTARDSVLVEAHPDWFARDVDGAVRSPYALDPDEPDNLEKRTVWGDLAEIDYAGTPDLAGLVRYWQDLARHHARLGFAGFRCDAAYKVPGAVWAEVISAARQERAEVCFFAETLGCQPEEVRQLAGAGFDYLFNSSRWWDFRADWLLEQYEQFRAIAPSIAFPESHDTERLAAESGGDERVSRLRVLFAAAFSSGLMMPMGYEYGFRRKPHVVETRPSDWEEPSFDLSGFLAEVNRMKAGRSVLNEEGPQRRVTPADDPVVALLRSGDEAPGRVLTLINPGPHAGHRFGAVDAARLLGCTAGEMRELMPGAPSPEWIDLPPLAIRLFASPDA